MVSFPITLYKDGFDRAELSLLPYAIANVSSRRQEFCSTKRSYLSGAKRIDVIFYDICVSEVIKPHIYTSIMKSFFVSFF